MNDATYSKNNKLWLSSSPLHILLSLLYTKDANALCHDVSAVLQKQSFCIINYVYWANIAARGIRKKDLSDTAKEYIHALEVWDFVLMDGIAFQIVAYILSKVYFNKARWYENINWTDFLPKLLLHAQKKYNIYLILYWAVDTIVKKSEKFLQKKGYSVIYTQAWYDNWFKQLDFDACQNAIDTTLAKWEENIQFIFIQWVSTLKKSLQEVRSVTNIEFIKKNKLLVCNQWGTFDHTSMWWEEKRSPDIVRRIKWERLRRLFVNPKKAKGKIARTFALMFYILPKKIIEQFTKRFDKN